MFGSDMYVAAFIAVLVVMGLMKGAVSGGAQFDVRLCSRAARINLDRHAWQFVTVCEQQYNRLEAVNPNYRQGFGACWITC